MIFMQFTTYYLIKLMNIRDYINPKERKLALEKELGINLENISESIFKDKFKVSKNCENVIGGIQIPVGIAGPLILLKENKLSEYYLPLATTEGALVASINRGCKAISESGGAMIISKKIGITRAPVFIVNNIIEGDKFISWVNSNFIEIRKTAEETSAHLRLLEIKPWMIGKNVFLRFVFDTQDAMGMNMATIASHNACKFIQEKTKVKLVSISGNMCVDKKANALNFIEGRGVSLWTQVFLSKEVIRDILKTNIDNFFETSQKKLVYGSQLSLTMGANAQIANVVAAIFLATGQDMAHVGECSMGITAVEKEGDGINISVYLPDMVVGTVGGGTSLPTQQESLNILGIRGGNLGINSLKLAEIIGGTVLAGEISLLASLSENSLACAHNSLGREK